jgi:hypothetical protein
MPDLRPQNNHAADPMLAVRGSEVAILREAIAEAQAQVVELAQRVVDAEQSERYYRGLYRALLREYAVMHQQRNQARAHAQAIGEQQPVWEAPGELATLSRALQRIAEGDYLDDVDARRVAEEALAAAARTLDAGSAA